MGADNVTVYERGQQGNLSYAFLDQDGKSRLARAGGSQGLGTAYGREEIVARLGQPVATVEQPPAQEAAPEPVVEQEAVPAPAPRPPSERGNPVLDAFMRMMESTPAPALVGQVHEKRARELQEPVATVAGDFPRQADLGPDSESLLLAGDSVLVARFRRSMSNVRVSRACAAAPAAVSYLQRRDPVDGLFLGRCRGQFGQAGAPPTISVSTSGTCAASMPHTLYGGTDTTFPVHVSPGHKPANRLTAAFDPGSRQADSRPVD